MKGFLLVLLCLIGMRGVWADEVELTYDVFSLPLRDAAVLAREKRGGEETYRRILKGTEEKDFRQERIMILKAANGIEVSSEEIEEEIFPSESDSPVSTFPGGGDSGPVPPSPFPTPATPTVWEIKHVGLSGEVRIRRRENGVILESGIFEVNPLGLDQLGKGPGMVEMPRFSVQILRSSVLLKPGKPILLGTMSPPKEVQGGKKKRVWFLFVTAREKA